MTGKSAPGLRYSILVPAYNAESTIEECLRSVQQQTVPTWELIVVDDGSTDSTACLVAEIAAGDARITLLRQTNEGTASARNRAAAEARGEYWLFLDADDLLLPEYLERQTAFIEEHPGFDIYSCNIALLRRDGVRVVYWRGLRYRREFSLSVAEQAKESSIFAMTVVRPRVFRLNGGFRRVYSEDYDFWLRALILGANHIFNPEILALYRRRESSKTTQLVTEAESIIRIQRDALAMPELRDEDRSALQRALRFSLARLERRRLEEGLLLGNYTEARSAYWRSRAAFPGRAKYAAGLALMLVSPALYARVKRARMI